MSNKIRVIRILEYSYNTVERMLEDRTHWQVKDVVALHSGMTIRSSVMVPDIVESTDGE